MSKDKKILWENALPKIDGLFTKQVVITATPKGNNFWYDLWCKSFDSQEKERGITITKK